MFEEGGQYTYNVILRSVCATIFAVKKAVNIKYSECVFVALGIEYEIRLSSSKTFLNFIS